MRSFGLPAVYETDNVISDFSRVARAMGILRTLQQL